MASPPSRSPQTVGMPRPQPRGPQQPKRSHVAETNMRGMVASHQQRLEQTMARVATMVEKPPQMPGAVPKHADAGYPQRDRRDPSPALGVVSSLPQCVDSRRSSTPQGEPRQPEILTGDTPRDDSALGVTAPSPRSGRPRSASRPSTGGSSGSSAKPVRMDLSGDLSCTLGSTRQSDSGPKRRTLKISPQSSPSSSSRGAESPRTQKLRAVRESLEASQSPTGSREKEARQEADEDEDDEDSDMEDDFRELDILVRHLGLRSDIAAVAEGSEAHRAPDRLVTSGSASGWASASTTVPSSMASRGEMASSAASTSEVEEVQGEKWFDGLRGAQRAHYELQQFPMPRGCRFDVSPGSAAQIFFTIEISDGPYTPASLTFWIKIYDEYPDLGGLVARCTKQVFHPNFDAERGHLDVQESDLEADMFRIQAVLNFIRRLCHSPAASPVMNSDAAALLHRDPEDFRRVVRSTLSGGQYNGIQFDRVLNLGAPKAIAATSPAPRASPSLTDKLRVELMGLEVMRDQFMTAAAEYQELSTNLVRSLETQDSIPEEPDE